MSSSICRALSSAISHQAIAMAHFQYLPLLLAFLLIALTLIFKKATNRVPNLPPSPWKLPLIGNMHPLLGALPHHALRKLSLTYGPIFHLKLGQTNHVIVASPEIAREILITQDINFASRPKLIAPTIVFYNNQDIAFSPYGARRRQLRKICVLELLSTRRVKFFSHIRNSQTAALVQSLSTSANSPVNLTEKILMMSSTTITLAAFGSECKHGPSFVAKIKKTLELMSGFEIADLFPSLSFVGELLGTSRTLKRIRPDIDEILDEIIQEHQVRRSTQHYGKEEGLVDVLLRLKQEGGLEFPLSIFQIKAVILDMFTGGTDTTSTTLVWVMVELMRHPRVMEKVQHEVWRASKGNRMIDEAEMDKLQYMKLVIKEALRLHPVIPLLLPRFNQKSCNVGGFEIPKETRVVINAWAMARDRRYWEDAESFVPERFEGGSVDFLGDSFQYLPFGNGRRVCPGKGFAMASVEVALANLLFHFEWELPDGMQTKDLDMTECSGGVASLKSDLCLVATPRFPQTVVAP